MGYFLGFLGVVAGLAGLASVLHSVQTAAIFWVITAVCFSGEAVVRAIDRLREAQKKDQQP